MAVLPAPVSYSSDKGSNVYQQLESFDLPPKIKVQLAESLSQEITLSQYHDNWIAYHYAYELYLYMCRDVGSEI